jgi:transcriptional regulator with XRE-family HTH domain
MDRITRSACRYHRRAQGLTQTGLAQQIGFSASYVKMFESGKLNPSQDFETALVDYFTGKGVAADKLAIEYAAGGEPSSLSTPAPAPGRLSGMATLPQVYIEQRQCFFVDRDIPPALVDEFLTRMDANEDRIAALFNKPTTEPGIFDRTESGFGAETEADLREVYALLAENFVLFRLLTGWNLFAGETVKADTIAAFMLSHYDDLVNAKRAALATETPAPEIEGEPEEVEA